MISVPLSGDLLPEIRFSFVARTTVISSCIIAPSKMRPRASRKGHDRVFALPRWLVVLVCLVTLTLNGVVAQNESETFESAFGLNLPESIEDDNAKKNEGAPGAKEAEAPLEAEELAVEEREEDLTPIEKKDEGENPPIQVPPRTEEAFTSKDESGEVISSFVQSGKVTDEKNGKYVRYGKYIK